VVLEFSVKPSLGKSC